MQIRTEKFRRITARITGCVGLALLLSTIAPAKAIADQFVGAVWSFEMTPQNRSLSTLKERYRIYHHEMFQRPTPYDAEFTRFVGDNYPIGNRTQFEVRGLRVFNERGQHVGTRNGVGRLSLVSFGQWSGSFVDDLGRTYDFSCTRVIE